MRSCLIQLIVLIAVVFCLLWFALPYGFSALATGALNASGFSGTDTKVEVSANPPPVLLTGHADRVHITSKQASMGDLHAATVDVILGDVQLLSRKMATVTGTLTGVRVAAPDGQPVVLSVVTLNGSATATTATASMTLQTAQALAESELKAQTHFVGKVALAAPDKVTLTIAGKSQSGRLVTANGMLLLVPSGSGLPTVTLIAPGSGNPFRVTAVQIGQSGVAIVGTLDVEALLS
jgi:hypothetical protein